MSSRKARPNPSNPARTNQPTQSTHRARRRAASRQSVPSTPAVVILLLTIVGVTVLTAAFRARHSAASDVAQSRAATTAPRAAAPGNAARLSVTPTIAPGQPQWTNDLRVSAYVPDANDGQWQTMPLGQAPNGSEFQYNGQLYSIDAKGGIWAVATITTAQLTEADRTYDPNGSRQPAPGDVVRFVDVQKRHLRHDFVDSFQAGDRFWFQGQLWEVFSGSLLHAGLDLRPAGDILAPAANIRTVPALAHLTLRLADGQGYYNSGPADNTYRVFPDNQMIPAAQLTAGQVIALDNGRQATVLGVQVQQGAFRVYQDTSATAPVAVAQEPLARLGDDPQLARLLDPNQAADIGALPSSAPALAALSGLPTNYLFTGQYYEPGTGLYLMGNRWYDPALGRFIQPDPLIPDPGNPQDLNRYSYVRNNPLRYTDPTGHAPSEQIPIPYPWLFELGRITQQMANALTVQAAPVAVPLTQYGPQLTQFAQGLNAVSQPSYDTGSFGDPNQWNPNEGPERESRVREMLSRRYQQSFGVTDAEIRANLGLQGKTADFVGYNSGNGRWLIAESKGGDMYKAMQQLENTMNGLLNRTGFQPVDMDLRIYTNSSNYQRLFTDPRGLGRYFVREGFLGWLDEADQWVWATINGVRVSVQVAP